MRTQKFWAAGFAILLLTVSCIGSGAPTSAPDAVGTIVAATMAAITPLATATSKPTIVPSVTTAPATIPPLVPTLAPPPATRINFLTGATTGIVSASIQPGQIQYYVVNASQGQPMIVMVNSSKNDETLSIKTQGGTSMLNQSSHQTSWQAMLPQTEDYYIGVYGGASPETYYLTIKIPSRIKFAEGKISASEIEKTVAGYTISYIILALKGQKMTVNLNTANSASLAISGYTDGQTYLSAGSGQTNFTLKLPATQDYILEVVPSLPGQVVNFELDVSIQ